VVAGIAALVAIVVVGITVIVRKRDHEKSGRNERILASINPKKVIQNTKKPGETKNNRERCFLKLLDDLTANWRRGLWAVGIFIAVWMVVYFIAFMTALGNDTPFARMTLKGVELFAIVANPLWGIPIAFLIGVYSKRK
jgi:hypothetical protein